jgi:hypothetical protein
LSLERVKQGHPAAVFGFDAFNPASVKAYLNTGFRIERSAANGSAWLADR